MKPIVIWVYDSRTIYHKFWHITRMKDNSKPKRFYKRFANDLGEIPVGYFNEITGIFEHCFNPRGHAYALRKDEKYRKPKNKE